MAVLLEVCATSLLKPAGQGQPQAIVAVVVGYALSFGLLALVIQRLEIGLVYAIWSACGTALIAAVGIAVYGETLTTVKVGGLALVISGVVVLNLAARA